MVQALLILEDGKMWHAATILTAPNDMELDREILELARRASAASGNNLYWHTILKERVTL